MMLFTIFLCACSNQSGVFGGEPLDDEKLSEIKASIFTENETEKITESTVAEKDETKTERVMDEDSEITAESFDEDEDMDITEKETEKESEEGRSETEASVETEIDTEGEGALESESASEHESEGESSEIGVVYWTKSGTVWHTRKECGHIKNSEVISGTVDEAEEAGKIRLCSSCAK